LNEHENGDLTINMGVSAGYRINKYFSVNSGLNLFSSSINFQGNNGILDFDTVNNDLQVETSSGEYTINESDFNNEEGNNEEFNQDNDETIQIDYTNNQHLKYIQIPLNFSFGIQKNKFRYFINSGIAYNRLVSDKNTFTTNGFSTVRSSNLNLVSKTNLTQTIALGVEYLIQPNMSISCSPTFTSSLININKSSTIQSKPYWLGLNFSINYFIK
jgi:long-subunit fatty acid transport protein